MGAGARARAAAGIGIARRVMRGGGRRRWAGEGGCWMLWVALHFLRWEFANFFFYCRVPTNSKDPLRPPPRRAVHGLTRRAWCASWYGVSCRATHEPTPGSIYLYVAASQPTIINASTRRHRPGCTSIRPPFFPPSVRAVGRSWNGTNERKNYFLSGIPLGSWIDTGSCLD